MYTQRHEEHFVNKTLWYKLKFLVIVEENVASFLSSLLQSDKHLPGPRTHSSAQPLTCWRIIYSAGKTFNK